MPPDPEMSYIAAVSMFRLPQLSPIIPLLALVLTSGGCSSSKTTRPMTIAVRDKLTQAPVASAHIDARTLHFFVPADVPLLGRDPILDSSPPLSVHGVTGPDGTVRMMVVVEHPVQVMVIAPGYDVQVVDLLAHPADAGPSKWLDAELGPEAPGDARRVEVRFLP